MLRQRLMVIIVLIPIVIGCSALGGWAFTTLIALFMGIAAWEFWRIFHQGGFSPSRLVLVVGVAAAVIARYMFGFEGAAAALAIAALVSMAQHVVQYEAGEQQSAIDLCITYGGLVYLGWLGSYLVSIRNLPDGLWWLLLALPAVWFTDVGGYVVGISFGKHKMVPRLSPHKSWEGYAGGILFSIIGSSLLALLWNYQAPQIIPLRGAIMGTVIALITPLGDLGESMIKRQFKIKDSSNIFPGHGGMLDRIDSWIWTGVIAYYLITWVWQAGF